MRLAKDSPDLSPPPAHASHAQWSHIVFLCEQTVLELLTSGVSGCSATTWFIVTERDRVLTPLSHFRFFAPSFLAQASVYSINQV